MSYLETLLTQPQPLEPHEVKDLEAWLATMEGDVAIFGAAPEDNVRIGSIKARLRNEQAAKGKPT